jgi:hypothetical protein
LFAYTANATGTNPNTAGFAMFDLSVRAVDNTLAIQVVDELGNVINYPVITDSTDPLLTGTVGLTTWGTENVYYTNYDGQAGHPLLTLIPEPSTGILAAAAALAATFRRKRPAISARRT